MEYEHIAGSRECVEGGQDGDAHCIDDSQIKVVGDGFGLDLDSNDRLSRVVPVHDVLQHTGTGEEKVGLVQLIRTCQER